MESLHDDCTSDPARSLRCFPLLLVLCSTVLALVPVIPAYLPLVDFPQHVALHSIWNHKADPAFNLNGRFEVSLATPYVLPHLAAHAAGALLGAEGGLRLVLLVSLLAFPLAALALLDAFGRPREIALAAFPAALSFVYWYGFTSYVMSLPLVLLGVAAARRCAVSGRLRDVIVLAILGLLTLTTHEFAFLVLLLLAGVAALGTTRALSRLVVVAAALLPGAIWSIAWGIARASQPSVDPKVTTYGLADERMRYLLASVFGSHTLEPRVLAIALGMIAIVSVAIFWSRRSGASGSEAGRRVLALIAGVAAITALLFPQTLIGTWGLWERIPPFAFVAFVGAVPWPAIRRVRGGLAAALAVIAVFASGTAIAQGVAFSAEAAGIREIAQQVPRGARVMWSACGQEQPWFRAVPSFRHLGAYVQAARGGDLSYSFARFNHMVVRYRGPPLPTAFDRSVYDAAVLRLGPHCPPLDELRKLGPLSIRGKYVAFLGSAVTPELAAALEPEAVRPVHSASLK